MVSKALTFLVIFILASCGAKDSTTPVKINLFKGNMVDSSVATDGGVLIFGRSDDGRHAFKIGVPNANQPLELNLARGKWEFGAITWEGSAGNKLTGINRCAYTGFQELRDAEVAVSLDLSQARCKDEFNGTRFSDENYITSSGNFFTLKARPCFQTTELSLINSMCVTNESSLLSYKIIYTPDFRGDVTGQLSALESSCYLIGSSQGPQVPIVKEHLGTALGFEILFFKNTTCDGIPKPYNYKKGVLENTTPQLETVAASGSYAYFLFNPGIMFDNRPPDISGQSLNIANAAYGHDSKLYVNQQAISYIISAAKPIAALEMCVTENSACAPHEWKIASNSGVHIITGGEGAHTLKLFYRNANNTVSVTPAETTVYLETGLLNLVKNNSDAFPNANVFKLYWYGNLNPFTVAQVETLVCTDALCSTELYRQVGTHSDVTSGYYESQAANILISMTSGNTYYAKITITDLFGSTKVLEYSPFIPDENLLAPPP